MKKTDALGPLLLFLVAPVVFRVALRLLALGKIFDGRFWTRAKKKKVNVIKAADRADGG